MQKCIRRFTQLFSLGAVMFIMEACYGTAYPGDYFYELKINVVDTLGKPINGIAICQANAEGKVGEALSQTDQNGKATINDLYLEYGDTLTFWIVDNDGEANGSYQSKRITIDGSKSEIIVALPAAE